jgi:hypothetical protein
MNAHGIRTRGSVVVLALLTLGATACGSSAAKPASATQPATATVTTGAASGGASTTTSVAAVATGHVGDTLTNPDHYVPSDVATVTLVKVIDPATQVDASNIPGPGNRWVGLEMTIVDNGNNASVAVEQASVTGSDGKKYAAFNQQFTECTSTMNDLQPNQKATFCPGLVLPKGVTITKVGYSTRTTDASRPQEITWTVP